MIATVLRDNILKLKAINHLWLKVIIDLADKTVLDLTTPLAKPRTYADIGQYAVMAYVATGDRKYVDAAVPKLLTLLTADPLPVPNNVREYFAELVILYSWIEDALKPEQRTTFEVRFNRWCEFACGVNTPSNNRGGWGLYTDSDLTTGQYLGLLLCDQQFGWKWTERDDAKKAREVIRQYAEKSKGGVWCESAAYNLGTLQFVLMGVFGAGADLFPEIKALVPGFVEQQLCELTPDFNAAYQWGDEEHPREMNIHRRISLYSLLIGLTGSEQLQRALDIILAVYPFSRQANLTWRALYLYQPVLKEPANKYLKVAEGNGHFTYKRENAAFYVHAPKRLGVQHEVVYSNDFQFYLDGEWVITRPLGYGLVAQSGDAGNSPLFAGLSSMYQRGPVSWKETDNGFEIVSQTEGPFYDPSYYKPPVPFVSHQRKLVYEFPGKLVVSDIFAGSRPTDLARYRPADEVAIRSSLLWKQVWHVPVKPEFVNIRTFVDSGITGLTWKSAKGKTCTLSSSNKFTFAIVDEKEKWKGNTNFRESELKFQVVIGTNDPTAQITTTLDVR